jgi:hypothetical protein
MEPAVFSEMLVTAWFHNLEDDSLNLDTVWHLVYSNISI